MSLVCANAIKGDYAVIGVDLPTVRGQKIIDDLNNSIRVNYMKFYIYRIIPKITNRIRTFMNYFLNDK